LERQDVGELHAGTVSLSASATNYVEADSGGSVTANTSGFTSGRCPLWQIVTDASSITTVTIKKHFLSAFAPGGVTGDVLSAAGATKEVVSQLGTISATGDFYVPLPNVAGTIVGARLVTATAVATDNTNYWQISAINLGTAGSGTTDVLDTSAANSTKTTGGSAMVAGARRTLTLHGTGANLITAATDILKLTFTKNGTATTMNGVAVIWDVKFTG
jgi:hypothetical protein